jgi:phytoene synthase
MRQAGVDPDRWLAEPVYTQSIGGVVRRLLHEAEILYRRADSGIARLPRRCRPAMGAARLLYAEIGREVQRLGYDSVSRRAIVSPLHKLAALTRLPRLMLPSGPVLGVPALAATAFLVDAAASSKPPARETGRRIPAAGHEAYEGRLAWILELFEDLERRDRERESVAGVVLDDTVALAQDSRVR